jgi:hypothetical protein
VKIQHGDDLSILIAVESCEDVNDLQLRCAATAEEGNPLLVWDGSWTGRAVSLHRGRQNIRLSLGPIHLTSGRYKLNLMLIRPGSSQLMFYSHQAVSFEITNKEIFSEIHTTFGFKELAVDPSW